MADTRVRRSGRPVRILAAVFLAAALGLTGCSGAADDGSAGSGVADKAAGHEEAAQGAGAGAADSAKSGQNQAQATKAPDITASHIIRTASLTVQVKDVPEALDEARTATENAGGFVGNETTTRDGDGRERTRVVLRVPTGEYDEVLADLEGVGKLIDRRKKAEDVTEQVVDVDSRIKSQRASVVRIRELMDQATKLSDVVTLEGELSRRQADLESLLAQQQSLKDRTSLATITLSLSETPVKKADKDEDPGVLDALAGGWNAFVAALRWLVVAVAAVLPFAVSLALLVVLWVRVVRPRLQRRPATTSPMPPLGPLPTARPAPETGRSQPDSEQD
ncbi:DUF4349 domain-containing protein [Streptomyces phyllanthi]|uniref:DUF4349 domain-containing protein n=1 Tax=Streptomyces phyllanthi TaxID=1803180 RepID=A0A5N8W1R8_9ACTN|nr:DUF4349 domain-containing protein [Streptomyces phyllanthi]MPY40816.1 DUF4349 domain-containing protein [Streptomyces phyllanthi]